MRYETQIFVVSGMEFILPHDVESPTNELVVRALTVLLPTEKLP